MRKRNVKNGDKFGRLTIKNAYIEKKHSGWYHLVTCDCGVEKIVFGSDVVRGNSSSCGCFRRDQKTKHGLYKSAEYKCWASMVQRCTNKKSAAYKNYGARGIDVCDDWLSFDNFIEDMGAKPTSAHTIERIDNDAGYNKNNCKWEGRARQCINQRIRSDNKTGHKGISFRFSSNKYYVKICIDGKQRHLGCFSELKDAVKARKQGENKYFNF